jgi:hypothetical protein
MPFAVVAAGLLSERLGTGAVFLTSAVLMGAMVVTFWLTPALQRLK